MENENKQNMLLFIGHLEEKLAEKEVQVWSLENNIYCLRVEIDELNIRLDNLMLVISDQRAVIEKLKEKERLNGRIQ